jgi:hypothetical protein
MLHSNDQLKFWRFFKNGAKFWVYRLSDAWLSSNQRSLSYQIIIICTKSMTIL